MTHERSWRKFGIFKSNMNWEKNHAGVLYEIDKLLILLLDDWIEKYMPLILMMIPVKQKDFF
jgi:hypothetical protein